MNNNSSNFSDVIKDKDENKRIDKWIADVIPDLSRSYIQKLIEDQNVFINGKSNIKSSTKIHKDDVIEIIIPESKLPDIKPVNIPLDILYEDEYILIVNKPKGMVVHPAPGHFDDTLVNAIMYHCGTSLSGINGILRPGIVHRIDQDTTGSLIVCKNDIAHKFIAEQLKNHTITREYRCIVCGNMESEEGKISGYIGRDPSERKRMAVTDSLHGKKAVTNYQLIKQFEHFAYISCQLETGRTHQIRVHMNSIHHPVLGDEIYGHNLGLKAPMKLQGQCLHAYRIGFIHPKTNSYVEFEAPLPEYFEHLLTVLG